MFEKLIEFISQFWSSLLPWRVLADTDAGLILRLGRYHRSIGPGFHWKWPLIEDVLTETIVITTVNLPTQTLTTKDGKSIVVSAIVKYAIRDVKPYLLEIWDAIDVLSDTTLGAIKDSVTTTNLDGLNGIEKDVLKEVRSELNQYGFKIHRVTFVDLGAVRSIRLITDNGADDE